MLYYVKYTVCHILLREKQNVTYFFQLREFSNEFINTVDYLNSYSKRSLKHFKYVQIRNFSNVLS